MCSWCEIGRPRFALHASNPSTGCASSLHLHRIATAASQWQLRASCAAFAKHAHCATPISRSATRNLYPDPLPRARRALLHSQTQADARRQFVCADPPGVPSCSAPVPGGDRRQPDGRERISHSIRRRGCIEPCRLAWCRRHEREPRNATDTCWAARQSACTHAIPSSARDRRANARQWTLTRATMP